MGYIGAHYVVRKQIKGGHKDMAKEVKNFSKLTCKELREIAKEHNIVGRWDMTKQQLVDAISEVENAKVSEDNTEEKVDAKVKFASQDENKMRYVKDVNIGVLVAFKDGENVRAAKVVRKSTKRNVLKLEDKRGKEFIISYNDVIWVRTGNRWPKGVYELLTGGRKNGKTKTPVK